MALLDQILLGNIIPDMFLPETYQDPRQVTTSQIRSPQPQARQAPVPSPPAQQESSGANFFDVLGALSRGYRSGGLVGAIANAGNIDQQLERQQQQKNLTIQALTNRGLSPEMASMIASDPELTKAVIPRLFSGSSDEAKYSLTPSYITGPEGKTIPIQFSSKGGYKQIQLPEGYNAAGGIDKIDLGTSYLIKDKRTGHTLGIEKKDIAGEAEQKVVGKIKADQPAAQARAQSAIYKAQKVADISRNLISHPGLEAATGPISSQLPTIRESTSNFETDVENLKTQVFVSAIQEMRELSKTGGALGQVTEREIEKMENSIRNLSLKQGEGNIRKNLGKLAKDFEDSIARIKQAYRQQYGADTELPPAATAPLEAVGNALNQGSSGWSIQKVQ